MTHSRTSWPSLALCVLLASAIMGALAWCGRPAPPKPVETTPTVVVVQPTPAPTLQTVIAGPPHARYTPTPAWTPRPSPVPIETILTPRPTSTPLPPTETPQPTPTSTPTSTLKPMSEQSQKG